MSAHSLTFPVGAEIVGADPSVIAAWKVKKRLDLEKTETAWRYMNRYCVGVIEREN